MKHALALVISCLFNDVVSISYYTLLERSCYYPSISLEGGKQVLTGMNLIPQMETGNGTTQRVFATD